MSKWLRLILIKEIFDVVQPIAGSTNNSQLIKRSTTIPMIIAHGDIV
jgi:hypothetical protein